MIADSVEFRETHGGSIDERARAFAEEYAPQAIAEVREVVNYWFGEMTTLSGGDGEVYRQRLIERCLDEVGARMRKEGNP